MKPLNPLLVLGKIANNDEFMEHCQSVDHWTSVINKELPRIAHNETIIVDLPGITLRALLEITILYRREGWFVSYHKENDFHKSRITIGIV